MSKSEFCLFSQAGSKIKCVWIWVSTLFYINVWISFDMKLSILCLIYSIYYGAFPLMFYLKYQLWSISFDVLSTVSMEHSLWCFIYSIYYGAFPLCLIYSVYYGAFPICLIYSVYYRYLILEMSYIYCLPAVRLLPSYVLSAKFTRGTSPFICLVYVKCWT